MSTTDPQGKVGREDPRKYHDSCLKRDAEDHNGITSGRQAGIFLARGGQDTTAALQKEAHQIGRHEGPGPEAFRQPRVLRTKVSDQGSLCRVQRCRQEGRRDHEQNQLYRQGRAVPRVLVQEQAADVAAAFPHAADEGHDGEDLPEAPESTYIVELDQGTDGEYDSVDSIANEVRSVAIYRRIDRTTRGDGLAIIGRVGHGRFG